MDHSKVDINAPIQKNVSRHRPTPRTRCAVELAREQGFLEVVKLLLCEGEAKGYSPAEDK